MAAAVVNPWNRTWYAARRELRAGNAIVHQDDETRRRLPRLPLRNAPEADNFGYPERSESRQVGPDARLGMIEGFAVGDNSAVLEVIEKNDVTLIPGLTRSGLGQAHI
jgi:hypothetical protein